MEYKRLQDICENFDAMRKPITAKDRIEGDIPYYGASGIVDHVNNYIFDGEYLLVSEDGANLVMRSTPIAFSISGKTWVNNHAHVLKFHNGTLQKYVEFYLNNIDLSPYITGTAQPKLNQQMLNNIPIPIVDSNIMRQQVEVLEMIQLIQRRRTKELIQLDQLIKARFVEMFDLENCDYGTFGNDTDFVDYRGKTPKLSDVGSIRMVNAKSVGKGSFKNVNEFVTEDVYEDWMHRGFGYPGDVLFVTEGHTFGNTCLVPDYLDKFALGQRVITIKGHIGTVENAFLCAYMQTDQFWKDINVFRTGGTAQGIRSKDLMKVRIPLPHLDTQKKFVDFVNQVYKSKAVVQKALKEYQHLFDNLMQKYFG